MTISSDLTYIAVGRASGNIHLYELSNPSRPARSTVALSIRQVLAGRKEGHLEGSRIVQIGFVGARHTSIVSADEHGRAFWWSLGKVLGVESSDVVRMLGSYPDVAVERPTPSYPSKRPTTLFAALPLPLGEKAHPTDASHLTALLTPAKLVVVGMKPTPKTWFRRMRDATGGGHGGVTGCASWLRSGEVDCGDGSSDPVLAYSWGTTVRFLRVRAVSKAGQEVVEADPAMIPELVEGRMWEATEPVRALQWFGHNVSLQL